MLGNISKGMKGRDASTVRRDFMIRILKLPVYISFVLATLVFAELAAGQQFSVANVISGRVVDKNGRAIEGAWVVDTAKVETDSIDEVLPGAITDSNGRFRIEHNWKVGERIFLDVAPLERAFTFYPITPPYLRFQIESLPTLVSIPVAISGEPTQDVGSITIDRYFPSVIVKLARKGSSEPVEPDSIEDETIVVFYDRNKKWVARAAFNIVRYSGAVTFDGEMTLGLPAGEWQIALCKDDECKTSFGETKRFQVTSSKKEKIVVLEADY